MSSYSTLVPDQFTTSEVVALTGLPKTMLDYLVRSEIYVPSKTLETGKRGKRRGYSFGDIVLLRALKSLLEFGISVKRLREALKVLSEKHNEITPGKLPGKYLLTDGRSVYFKNKKNVLEDLNAGGQMAFTFILELKPACDDIVSQCVALEFVKTG